MRILYIEDNTELREVIGLLIANGNRTVVACATAEEALTLDAQEQFDLVITDAGLPGLSGTDLARRILGVNPQRWVVLCSGYELGKYPLEWGPNVRIVLKPFEPEVLEQLLDSIAAEMRSGPA